MLRLWQGLLLLGLVEGKLVLKRTGCGRRETSFYSPASGACAVITKPDVLVFRDVITLCIE